MNVRLNFSLVALIRSALPLTVLLLTACLTGTGSGGSSSGASSSGSASISATATTTSQALTVGTAMTSFSPLTPSGGATPYVYSYGGTLPAGLSFSTSTGAVTGTPTATYSTANVVFSVQDANAVVASTTSTVSFTATEPSPAISATANTTAQSLTVGTAMTSFSPLSASGGDAPYTYSITSGTLPTGLSLNTTTGAVTGTPSVSYTAANVAFSVKDAYNVVASTTSTVGFTVAALPAGYVYEGGLTWMPISSATYTQSSANTRCTTTTINGTNDWRLPTETELSTLYTSGLMNGQGWTLSFTWSSTPYSAGYHYYVVLYDGYVHANVDTYDGYVTCVR